MSTKLTIAALLSVLAVPAFANGYNPGHQMQADLLNLDAAQFTTNELAQIDAEESVSDRVARIRLILEEKQNGIANF